MSRKRAWILLGLGTVLLCSSPLLAALVESMSTERPQFGDSALGRVTAGALFSWYFLPLLVLPILATVNWRPIWQRLLVFAPGLGLACTTWSLCNPFKSDYRNELAEWPLAIMFTTLPAFVMCVFRRWTFISASRDLLATPASMGSIMSAVTLWALSIGFQLWTMCPQELSRLRESPPNSLTEFYLFLWSLPLVLGIVLTACISVVLGRSCGKRWLSLLIAVVFAAFVLPAEIAWFFSGFRRDLDWTMPLVALGIGLGIGLSGVLCFLWLKLLGYKLIAISRS